MHRRRAGIDIDDIAILHKAAGQTGDRELGCFVFHFAQFKRFGRLFIIQDNAAVDFFDLFLGFKLIDVAANRIFLNVEDIAQIFNRGALVL